MKIIKVCRTARLAASEELERSVSRVLEWADALPEPKEGLGKKQAFPVFRKDDAFKDAEKKKQIILQFTSRRGRKCLVPRSL